MHVGPIAACSLGREDNDVAVNFLFTRWKPRVINVFVFLKKIELTKVSTCPGHAFYRAS